MHQGVAQLVTPEHTKLKKITPYASLQGSYANVADNVTTADELAIFK
uniref:Uncharacterized protein n=1 Tax=Arundo donax TaxID=35708 RepID=A0A0A9C4B6_ARUDO